MAETFNAGDTVRLKSGGPLMTVAGQTAAGAWECHWFNYTGEEYSHKFETFTSEMLKRIDLRS